MEATKMTFLTRAEVISIFQEKYATDGYRKSLLLRLLGHEIVQSYYNQEKQPEVRMAMQLC